jgi:hypothetical protein
MTLLETVDFLGLVNAYYPTWNPSVGREMIAKAWHADLQSYSVDEINTAFSIYRSQGNQFPPAQPGVLTSLVVDAVSEELSELEAWNLVAKACRNGIYHAEEEFAKLPEEVQKAVGTPGQLTEWATAPPDQSTIKQSNFLRSYRGVMERKRKDAKIPKDVRSRLEKIRNEGLLNVKD